MSRLTKRRSNYHQVLEKNIPQLIDISLKKRSPDYFQVLQDLIIKIFGATDCYIFKQSDGELKFIDDYSWSYPLDKIHPLVDIYKNKRSKIMDNLSDNLQMNKDQKFKLKYNLKNYHLLAIVQENYLLVVMRKISNLSSFQKKFLQDFEHNISLDIKNNISTNLEYLDHASLLILQTISKKDSYTGGHTKRVGMFAEMICDELGMDELEKKEVMIAAMIHDIGKIGIPDHILKKDAPLTDQEFEIMKQHPTIGGEILKKIPGFETISKGVWFHHERPDGKGYPKGLSGDQIPLMAKIISLSDAFDAMISTRPYRKAIPPEDAFDLLKKFSGTQFDNVVFAAFERAFLNSNISKRYRQLKKVG